MLVVVMVVDIVLSLLLLLPDDEPRVTARPDIEDRVNELPLSVLHRCVGGVDLCQYCTAAWGD